MPNLREKTWTSTTPANTEDAQFWEDHLISDTLATEAHSAYEAAHTHSNKSVIDKFSDSSGLKYDGVSVFQNLYKTVKVGTTDITASGEDTLELIAGSNVTITPNNTNKTITISASGGGQSTGDMSSADYDPNFYVKTAGGIPSYVSDRYSIDDTAETTLADTDKFPFYDDSASAKRSSTWSNIKAKLKSYFDGIYAAITAIGTYESGSTASRQYYSGGHFYKNGKFCTCKTNTAQGETWTLNTNYVEGTVADAIGNSATLLYSKVITIPNDGNWVTNRVQSLNIDVSSYRKIRMLIGKSTDANGTAAQFDCVEFDLNTVKVAGFLTNAYLYHTLDLYDSDNRTATITAFAQDSSVSGGEFNSINDVRIMGKQSNYSSSIYGFVKIYGIK